MTADQERAAVVAKPVTVVDYWECPMTGKMTVYFSDKRALTIDQRDYQRGHFQHWLESMGVANTTDRVDVIQYGRKVGELPAFWSPALAKSTSFLYNYRHGDLTLIDGKWHAARGLGAGDLDCLVGFVRKDDAIERGEHLRGGE